MVMPAGRYYTDGAGLTEGSSRYWNSAGAARSNVGAVEMVHLGMVTSDSA
jgi:hypothetical protein